MSVSQVLFGLGQLVRRRGSYKMDPLYILSNVIIRLVLVGSWWAAFSWHDVPDWSYRRTWFVMLNPLLVTTAAGGSGVLYNKTTADPSTLFVSPMHP